MIELSGPITSKETELKTLFEGINPKTGEVLRRGANTVRHYKDGTEKKPVVGFDITCSAPKSVSVLWALTPDARVKTAIVEAQKKAVAAVASYIERDLSVVRVGAGGTDRRKAAPILAAFPHSTSRTLDPQIHSHLVLVNIALLHDGSGRALDGSLILRESTIQRLGTIYRNTLEQELIHTLGVKTREKPLEKGKSFELADVPDWVCEVYSTRTQQIQSVLEPGDSVRQKQLKTLQTRPPKERGISQQQLVNRWQGTANFHGISFTNVVQKQQTKKNPPRPLKKLPVLAILPPPPPIQSNELQWPTGYERFQMKKELETLRAQRDRAKQEMQREIDILSARKGFSGYSKWQYVTGRISPVRYHLFRSDFESARVSNRHGKTDLYFRPKRQRERMSASYINYAFKRKRITKREKEAALLLHGHQSYDDFMKQFPTSRFGINWAYATHQIDAKRRIQLLRYHGHYQENHAYRALQKSNRERWQKLFAQKRLNAFEEKLTRITNNTHTLTKQSPKNVERTATQTKSNNTSAKQHSQTQQPPQPRRKHER